MEFFILEIQNEKFSYLKICDFFFQQTENRGREGRSMEKNANTLLVNFHLSKKKKNPQKEVPEVNPNLP